MSLKINAVFLLKKHQITVDEKLTTIYEFIDYALAASNYENSCRIITGIEENVRAEKIGYNDQSKYLFIVDDLDEDIDFRIHLNFSWKRKSVLNESYRFYKEDLTPLINAKDAKIAASLFNYFNYDPKNMSNEEISRLLKVPLVIDAEKKQKIKNEQETKEKDARKNNDFSDKDLKNDSDIAAMYSSIKKTIISQDEQIMQILTSLFKNQKIINSNLDNELIAKLKENILIYGSTGTGKTEILKRISKLYNIPIVIEDATSLSETGYVGRKVTDMLEDLCLAADDNITLAEKGILVIDEFDKLAENSNQVHVSRLGVQRSLLKLLDGSLFYFNDKKFDTSKLTIVALGAFTGITNDDDYTELTVDDFMNYGIMRELMGRFSKTIAMNRLLKEDIVQILKTSDFSPLNTYKKLFELLKVEFEVDDDFIDYIADLAVAKQSGARSLKTVFDDCISSALFKIFAGEYSHIHLTKPKEDEKPYVLTKKR